MTQWLIGIFVRLLSSKDDLCGRKQCFLYLQPSTVSQTVEAMRGWENELFLSNQSSFPLPFLQFLFQFGDCHHDFHGSHIVEIQILQFCDHCTFCFFLKEGHLFSNL